MTNSYITGSKGVNISYALAFISVLLFLSVSPARGQVIIKERMELNDQSATGNAVTNDITQQTASGEFPFWFPLGNNEVLVLKSGTLRLTFMEASFNKQLTDSTRLTATIIRNGEEIGSHIIVPTDHLSEPMNVNLAGCFDDRFFYTDQTERIGIGTSTGNGKDAMVADGSEYPGIFADQNFGDYFYLAVSGNDAGLAMRPDSVNYPDSTVSYKARSFLDFDLRNIKSPVTVQKASLRLNSTSSFEGEEFSLNIGAVNASWGESTVTWNNQPSASSEQTIGVLLNENGYNFDITSLFSNNWSAGNPDFGIRLAPPADTSAHLFDSSDGFLPPALVLDISNPAPPAANPTATLEQLQAGDIIRWEFSDFEVFNDISSLYYGEDYFELSFYREKENSFCGRQSMQIDARLEGAYGGPPQISLVLKADPATIAPGDTSLITPLMQFDQDSTTAPFPAGQTYNAAVVEGSASGALWNGVADTADAYPQLEGPFGFISADSLQADSAFATIAALTELQFIIDSVPTSLPGNRQAMPDPRANSQQPGSAPAVQTTALPDPLLISGTGQVLIRKDSLSIEIELPDSAQVWPTLRARDGGNDSTRSNMEQDIEVSLLRSGQAVTEHPVLLTAFRLEGSGGHEHELAEGSPDREQLGSFIFEGNTTEVELETETNAEGQIEFDYQSSIFSGEYVFKAAIFIDGDSLFAMDTLTVSVPNLVAFPDGDTYTLTGGDPDLHTNENIHYLVSQAAIDSLISAADAFSIASWNDAGGMRLNDMSLVWGGLFDVDETNLWQPPHSSHRVGTDVDIENVSLQDTTVTVVNQETGQPRERTVQVFDVDWIFRYTRLMSRKNWDFIEEGQQDPFRNPEEENPGIRYAHFRWIGN